MKRAYAIVLSALSILSFANISAAAPSGTANYVLENADRFDGKSVTVYVRAATAMRKNGEFYFGEQFDGVPEERMAEIKKEYVPFEAATIDTNGGTHGDIIVLVKKKKAKNFEDKYQARMSYDEEGAGRNNQKIPLNGKFDKALKMIIMR